MQPVVNGWLAFWTFLLVGGLAVYAVLAGAVTIGGVLDIRQMFRALDRQHGKGEAEEEGEKPST